MRITVYGGAGEIGGNLILLEDPAGTVLLDCGISFGAWGRYYHGFHQPAAARGLHDHLRLGLVPPLRGLYREDLLPPEWAPWADLPHARAVRPNAVLLTHAHQDHCGALPYVDPDIPVYTAAETALVLRHLQEWGSTQLDSEHRYTRRRVLQQGALRSAQTRKDGEHRQRLLQLPPDEPWTAIAPLWNEPPGALPWTAQAPRRGSRAGALEVRMYPVDHSMVGAAAFAVQTEIGWVVYTGDLRRHGRQGHLTAAFADAAARLRPAVLLVEGTGAVTPWSPSEAEVAERTAAAARAAAGPVVLTFAQRNLDRWLSAYAAAAAAGRRLLMTERAADFLRSLRTVRRDLPDPDAGACTWVYRKPSARATPGPAPPADRAYIRRHPEEFVICFGPADLDELLALRLPPGGNLIYAHHRPYSAEQAAELERLGNWAAVLGMRVLGLAEGGFHASGHLPGPDLLRLVAAIAPQRLVPVHTEHPEFFLGSGAQVHVPVPGEPLEFS